MKLPEPDPRETRDDTPEEWRNEFAEYVREQADLGILWNGDNGGDG